jgi:surface protein
MFNISYLLPLFLLTFLPFSNAVAITVAPIECSVTKAIPEKQWTQIGIPCDAPAGQNTVADIFSDDISGTYDTDWVLYSYNPTTNAYEKLALTDIVEIGKGYWLISFNQPATLDMPLGSQPVSIQTSTQCLFAEGCYETTVVANPGNVQYQMFSSPFDVPLVGGTLRINSGLETGLTLEESEAEDIFSHQLWHYNNVALAYDEIQNQIISPWTGFWVSTLPTASNSPAPKLLFPSPLAPITREELEEMIESGENVTQVNTSQIIDMSGLFAYQSDFNQDISNWNVGNVTNMSRMFETARSFNQDLSNWDVGNVTNMSRMFETAGSFNQDLSNWDVSNVSNMAYMFLEAISFNQDLSNWNVGNVTNMQSMFANAESFNQDLSNWDVSNVSYMEYMFGGTINFTNQDLSSWNVLNVESYAGFFTGAGSGNIEPIWNP